ncbi:nuclease, putative [Ricinus communis]|uniref:Nuclease, putative n=1 Tax=Ricinus communis TaxID=3988 RepID=B9T8F6_RICCO|nr:nuclease, putative [Ricinus communis]
MEQEKDAFFVVRKGDVVGVYKSFTDCQAQVGSSVCDPPVSVYKGYSLSKDTEEYLVSRGLQNALYAIRAQDLKEDLFGTLVPCPFQETDGSASGLTDPLRKHAKLDNQTEAQALYYDDDSCILEFDGASKGNPGPAGAGALLRTTDGRIICRLREGLGQVTNNVAEYRAMILGMKYALKKGYTKIRVQGDSKLVCSQVQGLWKVKHKDMTNLYEQAKQLKDKFASFQISHVLRALNSEADAQANLAIQLADGQVQEECLYND